MVQNGCLPGLGHLKYSSARVTAACDGGAVEVALGIRGQPGIRKGSARRPFEVVQHYLLANIRYLEHRSASSIAATAGVPGAPGVSRTVEVPVRIHEQTRSRVRSVRSSLEAVQNGLFAGIRHPEDRSEIGSATEGCGAVQVALRVHDQTGIGS